MPSRTAREQASSLGGHARNRQVTLLEQQPSPQNELVRSSLRRNFLLGVANGSIFSFGDALQDTNLVLSVFVSRLSGSSFLVGLLQPLRVGGWFLPQLLLSGYVQSAPTKMRYYRLGAGLRISACFLLAAGALLLSEPKLILGLTLFSLALFSFTGGLSGLAFTDIVGKTIPAPLRGQYFSLRMFFGGILAFLGSLVVRLVLSWELPFPRDYGLLFLLAAMAIAISMTAFAFVREPPDARTPPRASLLAQLRRAGSLPRQDRPFRLFLIGRVLVMLTEIAGPFYILYAKEALGLPVSLAGTYLMIGTITNIVSTYFWGLASRRLGSKRVMQVACALGVPAPLCALSLGALARENGSSLALPFAFVFVLLAITRTGTGVASMPLLLEVAPAHDRPIYIGFTNTLVGIASFANSVGGLLVEGFGYEVLLATAAAFYLLSFLAFLRCPEPLSDQAGE